MPEARQVPPVTDETQFFPKGALAFFSLMLTGFIVVWLFIYALMIYRAT